MSPFNTSSEIITLRSLEHYLQSLIDAKLWVKVVAALVLGVAFGVILSPDTGWVPITFSDPFGDWLALPGQLFLKLVQMIMIPLIFASIITGLVSTDTENLRRMGIGVGLYFISTTVISITLGTVLALFIRPGDFLPMTNLTNQGPTAVESDGSLLENVPGAISNLLPENPLASMVSGEMLSIVIFTIIIGVSITQLGESMKNPIIRLLGAIQEICMTIVRWAMRLVPYAVFGLMAQLTSSIGIESLTGVGVYATTVLIGLAILLMIYLLIVWLGGNMNPWNFMSRIRDVQLLAFSTTSSAAVMPLSIKTAQDKLGISKGVSNFLIPVGATVNMDGTAIYQCISTLFIAQAYGLDLGLASIVLVMFTIVAASIGTPAIPGGGMIILASVLQGIGIPAEGIVIIVGFDRILGMFRTAINVTGDLAACVVFDRIMKKSD